MMMYIRHGDFSFPLVFYEFFAKIFYVWSHQTGGLNLDGILRLYSKLPLAIIYIFSNSLVASYAYLIVSLVVIAASFYYFLRTFFPTLDRNTAIIFSVLFALNPVFLGNIAKTGLLLAVGMLPLLLAFLNRFIRTLDFKYLIFSIFAVNISFIHPFFLVINCIIAGSYFVYKLLSTRVNWQKFNKLLIYGFICAVMLNCYAILPILSLGTVEKNSLSGKLVSEDIDYSALISIANTKTILNAFSLSRENLLDFSFYTPQLKIVYLTSYLLILGCILTIFIKKYHVLTESEQWLALTLFVGFLLTIYISSVKDRLIASILNLLVTFPGGWIFRSPLKWQIYSPFFLFAWASLVFLKIDSKFRAYLAFMLLSISLIGSGYLLWNIYGNLLTPKSIEHYGFLLDGQLDETLFLIVNNKGCNIDTESDGKIRTDLNQVLLSSNTNVFTSDIQEMSQIRLSDFDYIFGCDIPLENELFSIVFTESTEPYRLYKKRIPGGHIDAFTDLYNFYSLKNRKGVDDFLAPISGREWYFINASTTIPNYSLQNIFGNIQSGNFISNAIRTTHNANEGDILYAKPGVVTYLQQSKMSAFDMPYATSKLLISTTTIVQSPAIFEFTYANSLANNIVRNSSFETDLWNKKVDDCNNFDNMGQVEMRRKDKAADGKYSLELEATHHTACTYQKISLQGGKKYFFSFKYQSPGKNDVGYYLGYTYGSTTASTTVQALGTTTAFTAFSLGTTTQPEQEITPIDEVQKNVSERFTAKNPDWNEYDKIIDIPEGVSQVSLYFYSYEKDGVTPVITRYDDVHFVQLPDDIYDYWLVSIPAETLAKPKAVTYTIINPTKKTVHISSATTPFYLAMSESYHPQWVALFANDKIQGPIKSWVPFAKPDKIDTESHFELDGFLNGWYVDVDKYCKAQGLCTKNANGSYDMDLVIEFWPQRWFYVGLIISGTTFVVVVGSLLFLCLRRRLRKEIDYIYSEELP